MAGTTTYYGISYPTNTDYVKDGATAMQTIADGFDSAVAIPTYNNQTGTSYTFVLTDAGKTVTSNNASAVTFTIPPQASVAWANNTTLTVRNLGAGVVTIAGGAGVTVTNTAQTVAQYGEVKLIRTASNAWTVVPASGSPVPDVVLASGTVSAQSATNLSNVLSDTYAFYNLKIYGTSSVSGKFQIRFRENTTDKATNYNSANIRIDVAGGTGNWYSGTGLGNIYINTFNTSIQSFSDIQICRPSATTGIALINAFSGDQDVFPLVSGWNMNMTNFNGLSMYPASGTWSGFYILTGRKA